MPLARLTTLKDALITVLTHDGIPVAVGRTSVAGEDATARVELSFKTEVLRCTITLLPDELDALLKSNDGEHLRHRLPAGNKLWLAELPVTKSTGQSAEQPRTPSDAPTVETYPLPPQAKLGATLPEQPGKQAAERARVGAATPQIAKAAGVNPVKVAPVVPLAGRRSA